MKHIVIGTAGHIDHGKTSLVKALTGNDLDRLKEEKLRGITIENGYTYFNLDEDIRAAIIDVPGHEKFIKNMIGGAASIDIVMMVIAADEGVMPQTIEHFNILKLLDIKSGIIVLTKKDLASEDIIEIVKEDINDMVKGSFLEHCKIVEVSSKSKEGIDNLIYELRTLVKEAEEKNKEALFRMSIDRIFSVKGIGTIVTGTALGGTISINDEVEINPGGLISKVRGIEVHNEKREFANAGERTAINLPNLKKEELKRGMVIGEPSKEISSFIIDCKVTLLKDAEKSIKNRDRVRIYCNTNEIMGRVILLDREELKSGETANVQIRLEEELCSKYKDKIIIRTYSPMYTIGGGIILEARANKAKRFNEKYIMNLKMKEEGSLKDRISNYILNNDNKMTTVLEVKNSFNSNEEEIEKAFKNLEEEKSIILIGDNFYIHSKYLSELSNKIEKYFKEYYSKESFKLGVNKEEFKKNILNFKVKGNIFNELLELLKERKIINYNETLVWAFERKVKFTEEENKIKEMFIEKYLKGGFKTEKAEDIIGKIDKKLKAKEIYNYLIDTKELIYIGEGITLHKDNLEKVKNLVINYIKENGSINIGQLKELIDSSRKYLVPILEYLDREKVTKRVEDKRVLA